MTYKATHVSYHDGSTAMLVRERKGAVRMMNEDGDEWSDPAWWWIPIGSETPEDYRRWAEVWDETECDSCRKDDCDGYCDYYNDLDISYDYPEYDPQTAHFERFGRPAFPNEY